MTQSRPVFTAALSANDAFKLKYPRYLKGAVLAALVLTALLVWLMPDIPANPYRLRQNEEIIWVDIPDPVDVPIPPIPLAAPRIPPVLEPVPDDHPDTRELIWDPPSFWDPTPLQPSGPSAYDSFLPSSTLPKLVHQVRADYPEIARRSGLEGTVLVHALVDVNGRVDKVKLIQGVHPILDKAALEAARKCQFTPARQREIKVKVWVAIPYRFRLG
jgi:periplasmic protein TonB